MIQLRISRPYVLIVTMVLTLTGCGAKARLKVPEAVYRARTGLRCCAMPKNVIASPDGSKLYVSVGSNSNAAES